MGHRPIVGVMATVQIKAPDFCRIGTKMQYGQGNGHLDGITRFGYGRLAGNEILIEDLQNIVRWQGNKG